MIQYIILLNLQKKNIKKNFNKLYLYMINKPYLVGIQEIKNNNSIAYKENFDLKEYQNILYVG